MSSFQMRSLHDLLDQIPHNPDSIEAHHGCCQGADAQAHQIFRDRGYRIVGHPPINLQWAMSQDLMNDLDEVCPPKDYNDRNRDIVEAVSILFGSPHVPRYMNGRKQTSGTWNTIEMGIKRGRLLYVVLPLPWETTKPKSPFFAN